jgi:hypothetical protein
MLPFMFLTESVIEAGSEMARLLKKGKGKKRAHLNVMLKCLKLEGGTAEVKK